MSDSRSHEADAVERVLARVENYPFEIDLLLADSGFYNERVIRRARDIAATVVHVPKKGERMKDKLDTHKVYFPTHQAGTHAPERDGSRVWHEPAASTFHGAGAVEGVARSPLG